MRPHHAIAVVAVILIGFGVKLIFFSAPAAEADTHAVPSARMDVVQMLTDHPHGKSLPVQKMHDMTFVFSDPD